MVCTCIKEYEPCTVRASGILRETPGKACAHYAGDVWALLIAGSAGWGNYRHQADVLHVRSKPPEPRLPALFALLLADVHTEYLIGNRLSCMHACIQPC